MDYQSQTKYLTLLLITYYLFIASLYSKLNIMLLCSPYTFLRDILSELA